MILLALPKVGISPAFSQVYPAGSLLGQGYIQKLLATFEGCFLWFRLIFILTCNCRVAVCPESLDTVRGSCAYSGQGKLQLIEERSSYLLL